MNIPSKAELRNLATLLDNDVYPDSMDVARGAGTTRRAAEILRWLADEQEPKEPKEDSGLLPCPFCGYGGVKINTTVVLPTVHWGECKSCHALGPKRTDESEASAAWNQRAEDAHREQPKVESLREIAIRFNARRATTKYEDQADLCAIVLRQVDRLEELIQHEFKMSGRTQGSLSQERAKIAQMREGSE